MEVIYHGHSCVEIKTNKQKSILVDPFITGNRLSDLQADEVHADLILLTHAHSDHLGDTVAIAKKNQATIIAIDELATYLANHHQLKTIGMNVGGKLSLEFGYVQFTPAIHTSSIEEDDGEIKMLGSAAGILLKVDHRVIYHAGDTALFSDLKLLENKRIDIAFLPIGDRYTMGIEDALTAAQWIGAQTIVPIHYNTFDFIKQNPNEFIKQLKAQNGKILAAGEGLIF